MSRTTLAHSVVVSEFCGDLSFPYTKEGLSFPGSGVCVLEVQVLVTPGKKIFPTEALFVFQAVIGYISSNHGACYINKQQHRSQRPAAQMPGMQFRFALFVNGFCNEAMAICRENVPYLQEKNSHASLKI